MTIEGIRKKITELLPKQLCLLSEMLVYWCKLCRYNASFGTDNDIRKMQYTLLRENHVIEKGLSMRFPKKGFGQQKVLNLIERLFKYASLYGEQERSFLLYPLSTIRAYIYYQKKEKVDVAQIEKLFSLLCDKAGIDDSELVTPAGISVVNSDVLKRQAEGNFESLLNGRHSIRYFKEEIPSMDVLNKALNLAQRTPSACNRQAWHTHVFTGDDCHKLLFMQGGCMGFYNDIHCCIVVTADMKGFLHYEPFQCYVDGGLYAQNLINALHFVGMGTIPLSFGFYDSKLSGIRKAFDIPENEVMILVIGVGILPDDVKIAESTRKTVETTNTYH